MDNKGNSRNMKKYSNNTTGYTGVTARYRNEQLIAYCAFWSENGKERHKWFSVSKYGESASLEMAINCRKLKISSIEDSHLYTDRHGT